MHQRFHFFFVSFLLAACTTSSTPGADAGSDAGGGGSDAGSDGGGGGADAGPMGAVCAVQHDEVLDGATIVVCDEAFASAPFVHLPSDSSSGGVDTVYGGIGRASGGIGLVARGRAITSATMPAWAEPEATFGALRYAYFLYRASVRGDVVESITPIVRIDDRVFARFVAGMVFEGGASARSVDPSTGEATFAFGDQTTPIRVRFEAAPGDTEVDRSAGFPRFALVGHVENLTAPMTSSTGTCLAALSSLGAANPYFGDTGDVSLMRYPGMHAPFDDVFTLAFDTSGNVNMGSGLYVSPADLLQPSAPVLTDATNAPHGTPTSGPSATLTAVDPTHGGASCTP